MEGCCIQQVVRYEVNICSGGKILDRALFIRLYCREILCRVQFPLEFARLGCEVQISSLEQHARVQLLMCYSGFWSTLRVGLLYAVSDNRSIILI